MQWKPNVTVAAIIERDNEFLMVEEHTSNGLAFNQPAGHLEKGEGLIDAIKREVNEETAWQFEPEGIVGIYLYPHPQPDKDITYLRVCFHGHCHNLDENQPLDDGIVDAPWLSRDTLESERNRLRSPLILQCIDDYLAGQRHPLEILSHHLQD